MASSNGENDPNVPSNKSLLQLCGALATKAGYKPFTTNNLIFYYTPLTGVVSYAALSVNVMNPSFALRILPKRDMTNLLLVHTLIGTGVYISNRKHLNSTSSRTRLGYSVFGAVMFTFGSVLTWAIVRSVLPENSFISTVFGLGSSYVLAKVGTHYMDFVDGQKAIRSS